MKCFVPRRRGFGALKYLLATVDGEKAESERPLDSEYEKEVEEDEVVYEVEIKETARGLHSEKLLSIKASR